MKSNNEAIKLRWELQQIGLDDAINAGLKLAGDGWPAVRKTLLDAGTMLAQLGPRMTEAMRYEYDLTPDSVVLDCGGYKGEWAEEIYRRYGCTVHVLEPVKEFYDGIVRRFAGNPKIEVHNFGLGGVIGAAEFGIQHDSTGEFSGSKVRETVQVKSVHALFNLIGPVSLLKLNIEGGEFCVLEEMAAHGMMGKARNIQVQFHDCAPDSKRRYDAIQERLAETHFLTLFTGWQWQNWQLKQ